MIPPLQYLIIETNLFYIIFWIIPRKVLVTCFGCSKREELSTKLLEYINSLKVLL